MSLLGTPRAFIGLDIGTSTVKVVELVNRGRRVELTAYAHVNLPDALSLPAMRQSFPLEPMVDIISRLLESAQTSADAAVMSLPGSEVFSTTLTQPDIPDKELVKTVRFAARDLIPTDLDEVVLAWSKPGDDRHHIPLPVKVAAANDSINPTPKTPKPPVTTTNSGKTTLFLTAVQKSTIAWHAKLMERLNLNLLSLELEAFSLQRTLDPARNIDAIFCDFGGLETNFHIIRQGAIQLSHTIDYGIHNIEQSINNTLRQNPADIHKIITTEGFNSTKPGAKYTAMCNAFNPLIKEAKSTIAQNLQIHRHTPSQAILVGGGAGTPALKDYWSQSLKLPASIGNPWHGLSYPQQLDNQLIKMGSQFAIAVGLARQQYQP